MKETNINKGIIELRETNTKKELVALLLDVRYIEIQARNNYDSDSKIFEEGYLRKAVTQIKKDKDKQIKILEKLLSKLQ